MSKRINAIYYSTAVACGAVYVFILGEIFGRLLVPNPVNLWLIEKLAKTGRNAEYNAIVYLHDLLIFILIALPFTLLLAMLPPRNSWKYLLIALATSLALQYWPAITDYSVLTSLGKLWQFYVGLGISLLGFPLAFSIVLVVRKRAARTS